jgi:hypothetical protein
MFKYELRCEICSSKFDSNYNIPKVLMCGHTVCSKCVDRMKEKNIYRCPFDRKVIDFDEDKIANNYYILSLIDGSIKENPNTCEEEIEEIFELNPKPVINNPGWKNTLDGFVKGDVLYTIESNGFFYCTDLNTGEWWFLYLNQFWGKHFFQTPLGRMFMIDQYGNLFQIFNKNYYIQIGKKNAWKNTTHLCTLNDKLFSIETSNKFYETNLDNGKWKEIGTRKDFPIDEEENSNLLEDGDIPIFTNQENIENQESNNGNNQNQTSSSNNLENLIQPDDISSNSFNIPESNNGMLDINMGGYNIRIPNIFRPYALNISNNLNKPEILVNRKKSNAEPFFDIKNATLLVSTGKNLLVANKLGELYLLNETTGESTLIRNDFSKNIEAYTSNSTHFYYVEKGGNMIYRNFFGKEDLNNFYNKNISLGLSSQISSVELQNQNCSNMNINQLSNENMSTPISDNIQKNESIKKLEADEKSKKRLNSSNATNNLISLNIQSQKNSSDNIFTGNTGNATTQKLLETESFIELEPDTNPVKIFADDKKVVLTDKKGELLIYDIESKSQRKFQCLFMLRNCHLHNTILVGDGDLVILDPIRLSLNKLNILTGSEVIILHSLKFLSTIKYIFSCNSKIYFVDITGSLFHFIESEKKISQVGNNGLCKYILDFAVHKNFLFTIENITLYKTNLADGNFVEIKNEYSSNYKYFFADNIYLIFINKEDEIIMVKPEDTLKFIKKIYHKNISKAQAITYFKSHIIYYDQESKNIIGVNLDKEKEMKIERKENEIKCEECKSEQINKDEDAEMILDPPESSYKILARNFPDVSLFVNNHDCLACILKDGVIYKLFC